MVQQVASSKTESAATALPFKFNANAFSAQNTSQQSFSNELLRQSEALNVYGQPGERSPISSYASSENQVNSTQTRLEQNKQANETREARQHRQAKQQEQRQVQNEAQQRQNETDKQINERNQQRRLDANQEARQRAEQKTRDQFADEKEGLAKQHPPVVDDNPNINKSALDASTEVTAQSDIEDVLTQDLLVAEEAIRNNDSALSAPSEHIAVLDENATQESFDYVSYVSQLADYTSASALSDNTESVVSSESDELLLQAGNSSEAYALFDDNFTIAIQDPEQLENNIEQIIDAQSEAALGVSVSKRDLQTIFDAQNVNVQENGNLSDEELAKVEDIIDRLLSKLNSTKDDSALPKDTEVDALDKELVQDLVLSQVSQNETNNKAQQEQTLGMSGDKLAISKQVNSALQEQSKKLDATLLQSDKVADELQATTELNQVAELEESVENAKSAENLKLAESAHKQPTTNKLNNDSGPTPDLKSSKQNSNNTSSAQILATLNDQQSKAALDNISQRIQDLMLDANPEYSGNEFIAALQNGVKEFKQQLALGREIGVELKTIVTEALTQANAEVSSSKQTKIDATLNQFNTALSLSSAINNSISMQQTQSLGVPDNQFAKEMSHLHIEGTKLANATNSANNQLQNQSAIDKAVNIFKPEGQQQLAEKVRWMVNSKNAVAEIRLDPPDLGGINIKVNLSGDTAQVNFNVQSAAAKEALDQAAPRLREMLQERGIELGQSNVQQDSGNKQDGSAFANSGEEHKFSSSVNRDESVIEEPPQIIEQNIVNGILGGANGIDYYA